MMDNESPLMQQSNHYPSPIYGNNNYNSLNIQDNERQEQNVLYNLKRQTPIQYEEFQDPEMKVACKQNELQNLLQQLYQAEAAVRMEMGEVTRSQQVAQEAARDLEEATNKVRLLSSDLKIAKDIAGQAAIRAHTAQLQLSAHDQLMFTARQLVDALSSQMVSAQSELVAAQEKFTLRNSTDNLESIGNLTPNTYQTGIFDGNYIPFQLTNNDGNDLSMMYDKQGILPALQSQSNLQILNPYNKVQHYPSIRKFN